MTIFVLNPNTSTKVTEGISAAVAELETSDFAIACVTSAEGPVGIETDEHVRQAAEQLEGQLAELEAPSAVVVACFSDPGVAGAAARVSFPVIGIRQAAVTNALRLGNRFGVIAMGPVSIPRHMAAFKEMNVMQHVAGDRSVGLNMLEMIDRDVALPRLKKTALQLRDIDNADVLILGCAGMLGYKTEIEDTVGLPVVEPCSAGVAIALECLQAPRAPITEQTYAG